jgi:predicted NBD/HSP70 family sugar kinase
VADGDPATCAAVDAAGRQLGILLNNLWAGFDPMAIVIGGPALQLGDVFIEPARHVLAAYAHAAMLSPPDIRTSHFGAQAVAVGAAALARYRVTRPLDVLRIERETGRGAGTRPAGLAMPH